MDGSMKKMLTEEVLGEKWHEVVWGKIIPWHDCQTKTLLTCSCGNEWANLSHFDQNRTFTSPDDMIALKDKIVDMGEWEWFVRYCNEKWWDEERYRDFNWCEPAFTKWLFTPTRFCELCATWWEERGKESEQGQIHS